MQNQDREPENKTQSLANEGDRPEGNSLSPRLTANPNPASEEATKAIEALCLTHSFDKDSDKQSS